jgi:hypothetical protein
MLLAANRLPHLAVEVEEAAAEVGCALTDPPSTYARALSATEELERQHRISDVARIGGTYHYHR